MNAKQLTAAETIVMKCIWDADHEMSLAEIVKNANEGYGKEWKPQTVSTYLAKLCLKNSAEFFDIFICRSILFS